jgi:hypothetical protein
MDRIVFKVKDDGEIIYTAPLKDWTEKKERV